MFYLLWLDSKYCSLLIVQGFLFILAASVTFDNFKRDSPFAHMLPSYTDAFLHPIRFTRTIVEVLRLHTAHRSELTAAKRKKMADDVKKRATYRQAHGLDMEEIFGWTSEEQAAKAHEAAREARSKVVEEAAGAEKAVEQVPRKRKVWLGIW